MDNYNFNRFLSVIENAFSGVMNVPNEINRIDNEMNTLRKNADVLHAVSNKLEDKLDNHSAKIVRDTCNEEYKKIIIKLEILEQQMHEMKKYVNNQSRRRSANENLWRG